MVYYVLTYDHDVKTYHKGLYFMMLSIIFTASLASILIHRMKDNLYEPIS